MGTDDETLDSTTACEASTTEQQLLC